MYLNGFSVRIDKGKEGPSQYFKIKHGQKYRILLRNHNEDPCDAKVEVDGKDVGVFRLNARENLALERPTNESKCFTFYHIDSEEADETGLDKVSRNDLGLIRVTFTPGTKKYSPYWIFTSPYSELDPPVLGSDGFYQTTWGSHTYEYPIAANNSLKSTTWSDSSTGKKKNSCSYNFSSDNGGSCFYSSAVPSAASGACRGLCADDDLRKSKNRKAGGTGLSGSSNQKFYEVEELDYNYDMRTEITVRLVPDDDCRQSPSELKPVVNKTKFPTPLWCII